MKKKRINYYPRKIKGIAKTPGISGILAVAAVLFGLLLSSSAYRMDNVEAARRESETVDIRIIGTTDLHGQLNSKDYEQGVDYNNGGLARVMNLIAQTRDELPQENTITVDAGDVLFDYTTEYIFSENQEEIQPIYQAMARIGYDAITLGNHDFDYGYDYIQRQLTGSGLKDITVVSNVTESKTGDYPFLENMLITRNAKTSLGNIVEVKIGIIGQTIPTLTAKTHSYAGILKTEDMVANAQTQATKLKEMGADIIIALSHTGIGPENPELNFKNVAYALSKIPEIDVVVCGHEHNLFPTQDMTSPYYKLPNVDKETYLMNGKNVIMAGNRGKAIGVVNLKLEVSEDSLEITDRKSEIRMVAAKNIIEDRELSVLYGDWEEKLSLYSTDIIGTLDKEDVIQNFYGLLGDNTAIQLLNNSKIHYAMNYINTTGKTYKDYPVIAASTYASYGINSPNDFINIKNQITESNLTTIQPYNSYIYLYTITGFQLREWLEWSASAYETTQGTNAWTDINMSELMKDKDLKSLIAEEWLDDWSNFYVFDGIDYVINPSAKPRYDISGNRINSTYRIKSITYNGEAVQDNAVFVLATDKITKPMDANKGIEKQVVLNGFIRSQTVLSKYIKLVSNSGDIQPQLDYNWRVSLPRGYQFLIKVPYYADKLIKETQWYKEFLTQKEQYRYYVASYPDENEDNIAPNIIAVPLVTSVTASSYDLVVHVADKSEIKYLRVMSGEYDLDFTGWAAAKDALGKPITIYENGIYSIYAEDIYGNKSTRKLIIDNFNSNLLARPVIDTYTNRKTKISGKAEPNTTIVFEAYTGIYEAKVNIAGKFSYPMPSQPSGTVVRVYIKDEVKGLESERVLIPVKRTGPNQPTINPVYNNVNYLNGDTNDSDASVIAIIGDKVYVSENGGRELYENNKEIYKAELEIVEVFSEIGDSGYYFINLPHLEAGSTIQIYNIDHLSRNSRVNTVKVQEIAPNAPVVYDVSNIEKSIAGYVPSGVKKVYNITLTVGESIYTTKTDKDGNFTLQFTDQLQAGQPLTVTASDTKNGKTRYSYGTEVIVENIENYISESSDNLIVNRVTVNSNLISGFYYDGGMVYLAICSNDNETFTNTIYQIDTDHLFKFRHYLEGSLEPGTTIYAMARFSDGKIRRANKTVVLPSIPDAPTLLTPVANTDKEVQVVADKDCEVILTIGKKTYLAKEYKLDEISNQYVYTFITDRDVSGTAIAIQAVNIAGASDVFETMIVKTAPDAPEVNPIIEGDTIITGKIELLDYVEPVVEAVEYIADTAEVVTDSTDIIADTTKEKPIPKVFLKAPPKVVQTQTRIFASIDKKTYEGTIDDEGNFTIKIPAKNAGTAIKLWGTNKAGRGPLIK
ncbi:MAG TPA: Ig-like domain-containing protein, partial [Mobilitalea sp.]|nr:Ig-like domain-containing protein [Mobilitalea sp.]